MPDDWQPALPTRLCSLCFVERPVTEFHRRGAGHQRWCKPCRRAWDSAYHAKVRPLRLLQLRQRKKQLGAWLDEVKRSQPCVDCGGWFHPAAMGFDHLPGKVKRDEVSDLVRSGCSTLARAEILKCELVCANCHAVRTYMRRKYGSSYDLDAVV